VAAMVLLIPINALPSVMEFLHFRRRPALATLKVEKSAAELPVARHKKKVLIGLIKMNAK